MTRRIFSGLGRAWNDAAAINALRPAACAVAVLIASMLMLTTAFATGFVNVQADETMLAWAAKQALHGRTPYRDFFMFQPPLLVYGLAAFYAMAGATLASLRVLSIAWLSASAVVLYLLLHRQGMPARWAVAAALLLPGLLVPFWPVSSHHWFALGFGLGALLLVSGERPGVGAFFAAGVLAAFAGLCVQTSGVVFCALLAGRWFVTAADRPWPAAAGLIAGVALPLAGAVLLLVANGALPDAIDLVVRWPMQYYKQPQGFNDVGSIGRPDIAPLIASARTGRNPQVAATLILIAVLLALVLRGVRPAVHEAQRVGRLRRWTAAIVGAALAVGTAVSGRLDWIHLILTVPPLLYLALSVLDWRFDTAGRRCMQALLVALLAVLTVRWTGNWAAYPPSLAAVLSVDRVYVSGDLPSVLDELPDAREGGTVLFLSHGGSGLYFFHAPEPPPVDWVLPPVVRYNSRREYEWLASFLSAGRVPYVLIPRSYVASFLNDESPLRSILREEYEPAVETKWGLALRRSEAVRRAAGGGQT